jgi:hypothetical protein
MGGKPLGHCHFQKGNGEGGVVQFNVEEEKGEAATQLSSFRGASVWGDCFSRQWRREAWRLRQLEVEENGTRAELGQLRSSRLEARRATRIKIKNAQQVGRHGCYGPKLFGLTIGKGKLSFEFLRTFQI